MEQTTVDKVLERLDKLGELSIQGFEILARQAYIEGIKYLVWGTTWLLVAFVIFIIARRTYKGKLLQGAYSFEVSGYHGMRKVSYNQQWAVFYHVLTFPIFLIALYHFNRGLLQIANPEFYAIKYILDSF